MSKTKKFWLAMAMICCLVPATFADRKCRDPHDKGCREKQSVPEGGSTAMYLLGAGLTCVGAMVLRSRTAKSTQS